MQYRGKCDELQLAIAAHAQEIAQQERKYSNERQAVREEFENEIAELEAEIEDRGFIIDDLERRVKLLALKLNTSAAEADIVIEGASAVPPGIMTVVDEVPMGAMTVSTKPREGETWGAINLARRTAKVRVDAEIRRLEGPKMTIEDSTNYTLIIEKARMVSQQLIGKQRKAESESITQAADLLQSLEQQSIEHQHKKKGNEMTQLETKVWQYDSAPLVLIFTLH